VGVHQVAVLVPGEHPQDLPDVPLPERGALRGPASPRRRPAAAAAQGGVDGQQAPGMAGGEEDPSPRPDRRPSRSANRSRAATHLAASMVSWPVVWERSGTRADLLVHQVEHLVEGPLPAGAHTRTRGSRSLRGTGACAEVVFRGGGHLPVMRTESR
jgi:hypothetical protein